jgi:hypothetical protein
MMGATTNSQSWLIAVPPTNTAGAAAPEGKADPHETNIAPRQNGRTAAK